MKRKAVISAVVLIPLLSWLLWPAADPKFTITDNAEKLAGKTAYLAAPHEKTGERPNVIVLLADDLGKHDLTLYGPAPVETPAIDSIAKDGVAFTDGYITSPICAPSRAGLMTGRYQQRYGFELVTHERYPRNNLEWYFAKWLAAGRGWEPIDTLLVPPADEILRQGLPESELTLAEILKTRGYATAIFGKWHLGFHDKAVPHHRGFDYHYGFYEAFSLYQPEDDPDVVNAKDNLFADRYQWSRGRHGNCAIRKNGVELDEKVYLTSRIADETVAWIKAQKDPYFAYVPFSAPHAPLQAPREYYDRFAAEKDHTKRVYYAMIAALDDAVKKILEAAGSDTIVFFLSDNGGATYTGTTDNHPLQGGKFTNFEGGLNVPFAMRYPGLKGVFREPVSSLDIFATIIAAAGAELPKDRPYDGVDLKPHILASTTPHASLYWRAEGHRAVRQGAYKLISDNKTGSRALFDVTQDKSEKNDLAEKEPQRVAEMEGALKQWETQLIEEKWPRVMDYHFTINGRPYIFPL